MVLVIIKKGFVTFGPLPAVLSFSLQLFLQFHRHNNAILLPLPIECHSELFEIQIDGMCTLSVRKGPGKWELEGNGEGADALQIRR